MHQESLPTMYQEEKEAETREEENIVQSETVAEKLSENEPIFEEETPIEQTNQEAFVEEVIDEIKQEINDLEVKTESETCVKVNTTEESIAFSTEESNVEVKRRCPTRGALRRKRDKKIIEKIRSYYEAAAEAEDEEESVKDGENNDQDSDGKRRSSFSQIPAGLVKESVSRFSSNENPEILKMEIKMKEEETVEVDKEENGLEICEEIYCEVVEEEITEKQEESETENEQDKKIESKQACIESEVNKMEAKPTSPKLKEGDVDQNESESVSSGTKVGRWSRHSRIVSANRALFEGMASDVARIGLFEAGPVADLVVLENSERILSKVQTLARMYSEKANHMKVPLHQKKAIFRQSWSLGARLTGAAKSNGQSQNRVSTKEEKQKEKIQEDWTFKEGSSEASPGQTKNETPDGTWTNSKIYSSPGSSQSGNKVQEENAVKKDQWQENGESWIWVNSGLVFI